MDALGKLGGEPCPKLRRTPPGCGIHPTRPRICRRYRCLWLQGAFEPEDRPDRVGAVLDLISSGGTPHLAVREATPGASRGSPRLREIVERYRTFMPVRITDTRDVMNPDAPVRVLLPGGEERVVEGDWTLFVDGDRAGERRRLPWLQRVARRVGLTFASRRLARARRARRLPGP